MKLCLICYHANITAIYKPAWVEQFWESVIRQTYNDFTIYEVCYNGKKDRIFQNSIYESIVLPSFIDAMNYLIDKALTDGADIIGNLNCDDIYHRDWIKTELPFIKYHGFDIVSCNFSLMQNDMIYHQHFFDKLNIQGEMNIDHNVVCHPAVLYSKSFLQNNRYVPEEFPIEDLLLWKRSINKYKFKIVSENLLIHRIHENSVCKSENR